MNTFLLLVSLPVVVLNAEQSSDYNAPIRQHEAVAALKEAKAIAKVIGYAKKTFGHGHEDDPDELYNKQLDHMEGGQLTGTTEEKKIVMEKITEAKRIKKERIERTENSEKERIESIEKDNKANKNRWD